MGFNDFKNKAKEAAPKERTDGPSEQPERLHVINMGAYTNLLVNSEYVGYSNQGTIKFIPIVPLVGPDISYLYDVSEFQVNSPDAEGKAKWSWYRFPQVADFNQQLTPEQSGTLGAIHSLITKASGSLGYGTDWARFKNYCVFFGYVLQHVNHEGVVLTDHTCRKMALIIIPSKNMAKAFTTMCSSLETLPNAEQMYDLIFNRESLRNTFLEVSFKRGSGFGYDCTCTQKTFDAFAQVLLKEKEVKELSGRVQIPDVSIALCKNHIGAFSNKNGASDTEYVDDYVRYAYSFIHAEVGRTIRDAEALNNIPPAPPVPNENQRQNADAFTNPPAPTPPPTYQQVPGSDSTPQVPPVVGTPPPPPAYYPPQQ